MRSVIDGAEPRRKEVRRQIAEIKAAARAREVTAQAAAAAAAAAAAGKQQLSASGADAGVAASGCAAPVGVADGQLAHHHQKPKIVVTLTADEKKSLAELEIEAEREEERRECLGRDRHGNRYWLMGARISADGSVQEPGCIFVETRAAAVAEEARGTPHGMADGFYDGRQVTWGCYPTRECPTACHELSSRRRETSQDCKFYLCPVDALSRGALPFPVPFQWRIWMLSSPTCTLGGRWRAP